MSRYIVQVKNHVGGHWEDTDARGYSSFDEARGRVVEEHARYPFLHFRIVLRWTEEREIGIFKGVKNV